MPEIPSQFLIERQGKKFVLYAGLLHLAHEAGLERLDTELVRFEPQLDPPVVIFRAEALFRPKDGLPPTVFIDHGDATPKNVGGTIAPHYIRMAATRAKARCLRDALDIGYAAIEEIGADDEHEAPAAPPPRRPVAIHDQQVRAILALFKEKRGLVEVDAQVAVREKTGKALAELTSSEANKVVEALSKLPTPAAS